MIRNYSNSNMPQGLNPLKLQFSSNNSGIVTINISNIRSFNIFSSEGQHLEEQRSQEHPNSTAWPPKLQCSQDIKPKSDNNKSSEELVSHSQPNHINDANPKIKRDVVLPESKKIKKSAGFNKIPSIDAENQSSAKSLSKKKSPWSSHQDAMALRLTAEIGPRWSEIGRMIGGKTGKQVRDRYLQRLRPDISFASWTKEEDAKIISLYHELGNKWLQIAEQLPGRTDNQVKNRFHSKLRKLITKKGTTQNEAMFDFLSNTDMESLEELEKDYGGLSSKLNGVIDFESLTTPEDGFSNLKKIKYLAQVREASDPVLPDFSE